MKSEISDKDIYRLIKKREEENKVFKKLLQELDKTKSKKTHKKKVR
ncbi:hypothetical protein [Carboxylicivirga sp. M1479]|nr:hypothetical protein [Carboxylicivirga sp. M1479]